MTPEQKLDAVVGNYIELTDALRQDVHALLDVESDSQAWRRSFIRAVGAFVEGHAHCLREISIIALEFDATHISKRSAKVLVEERGAGANDRIKVALSAAHKFLELQGAPDFSGAEWSSARRVLDKRHLLMHPKSLSDLEISDSLWRSLRDDAVWLIKQFVGFMAVAHEKYGS